MFTDGLDSNALRWVKEGKGQAYEANNQKDDSNSYKVPNLRPIIGPLSNIRSGEVGRGYGLLPTSKFLNGHLPVSRTIPVHGNVSASVSDDDMSTDSEEEEVYGGRYSLDSSPQDDRAPTKASVSRQHYGKPLYATDSVYSDDVSSSMEAMGRRNLAERSKPGSSRHHPLRRSNNGYTDEDSDESNASSEFSSTQPVSKGPMAHVRSSYASDGYASSVYSAVAADKGPDTRNMHNEKMSDEDVPSAPPFFDSTARTAKIQEELPSGIKPQTSTNGKMPHQAVRTASVVESGSDAPAGSVPARLPTFHASSQGPWLAVIAYDACVRLCLHAWAKQCMEAPMFLESECGLLRNAFGLQRVLLQSEEELLVKRSSVLTNDGAAPKPRKMVGKMKVQVRKVKMAMDPPTGCTFSSLSSKKIKLDRLRYKLSNIGLKLSSGWRAVRRIHFSPRVPPNGSFSRQTKAYMQASAQYVKQVSGLLKVGVTTLRNNSSSYEAVQENTYSCFLRLKSSSEEDVVRLHPGSGETHVFLPDSLGDDLIVEVHDSKGKIIGRVLAQIAAVAEDPGDKLRWWSIFHEPEHELVGKLQLYVNYSTTLDENNLKCGSVAETVAYDLVLEVAMKVQQFQQRNLLLHGPWKWLLTEFSTYYGVSDAYTRLRYLSYIMDVATPTADCLTLVHDLLLPVIMKGDTKRTLSHQENRILGDVEEQINQILSMVFENYKSLDETAQSGMMDVFRPATGIPAPALEPAVKLFTLLHDILSPESQTKLYGYFQAAAKKRARRHLTETDEFVTSNINESLLMDPITVSTAYQKMKSLCFNIRNECFTDIEIHNQHVLPSFIDLPNLSSAIYSVELCNRLREFLIACPPSGPSPHVAELVIATADFQRDLCSWRINPVKGGVDAKELFHLYIMLWIQDKRLALLESCKLDKVKWSGVRTQHSTTPFVDDMYDRLNETLNDYEVIICRWPEYTFVLENAIADIEKATVEALEKQYADVLLPLKENLAPKKFGLKYVQKLTKRSSCPYIVPDELGILLNSLKRILDALRPKIEQQFKSWGSCIPDGGNTAPGERLSEVTVMLRTKFRNYIQAVVEKLVENTKLQNATKLKKILQDSKENVIESDIRNRIQPLKDQLTNTITHLQGILATQVFIFVCRGYWDRMGQEILTFLENRKENRSWYKGSTIAVSILDDTFGSQMQQLLGNSLREKDVEPPKTIMEVRSMLCKDAASHKSNSYYF